MLLLSCSIWTDSHQIWAVDVFLHVPSINGIHNAEMQKKKKVFVTSSLQYSININHINKVDLSLSSIYRGRKSIVRLTSTSMLQCVRPLPCLCAFVALFAYACIMVTHKRTNKATYAHGQGSGQVHWNQKVTLLLKAIRLRCAWMADLWYICAIINQSAVNSKHCRFAYVISEL